LAGPTTFCAAADKASAAKTNNPKPCRQSIFPAIPRSLAIAIILADTPTV
jgi:hypothetical protein